MINKKKGLAKMSLFLALSLGLCLTGCVQKPKQTIAGIGANGNIERIVVPDAAPEPISLAASELQRYIKQITGKELPIQPASASNNTACIRLTLSGDSTIHWDGYSLSFSPDSIVLRAGEARGVLYAAYSLLEKSGCSFFYPGAGEEIVPKKSLLEFSTGKETVNPILEHRGLTPYGLNGSTVEMGRKFIDWMAKNKLNYILVSENRPSDSDGPANGLIWKEVTATLLPELKKRGFIIEMSEHCAPVFFPRSLFKEHPDWFALNNGVRKLGAPPYSGQMCYSNKAAVEFYGNAVAAYAVKHPEFQVIGTWPLDGGGYCECENCKDPLTIFSAVLKVAEKVHAVRPDITIEHLAYQRQTLTAPDIPRLPAYMSVLWCPDAGKMADTLKQWISISGGSGGVEQFEYLMGDNYRARANVWLRPYYAAGVPGQAAASGFRGVISLFLPIQNWWRASFNNWFFARACWDKALNVDSAIQAYCSAYYPSHPAEVNTVFRTLLHDFQREPFRVPDTANRIPIDSIRSAGENIIHQVDALLTQTRDQPEQVRLQRLKTFIEFSLLHQEAFSSGKKKDLDRVLNYARTHPEQDMVLIYPGYIQWRDAEYFK